jgi:hypothetical protein
MSSKIEIPKLLAWRLAGLDPHYTTAQLDADEEELQKILAAPVVERQPFRFLVKSCYGPRRKSIENADESMRDSIESARQYFGAEHEIDAAKAKSLVYISPGEWFAIPLYTAPPELAELQATIARLTAENDEPEWHQMMTKLEDQNTELRAENERLKGGQGEPVYQVLDYAEGWKDVDLVSYTACSLDPEVYEVRVLYTSRPAPVSVPDGWKLVPIEPTELMVRRGDQNYSWSVEKIYNAMIESAPCLDKVKEMDQ